MLQALLDELLLIINHYSIINNLKMNQTLRSKLTFTKKSISWLHHRSSLYRHHRKIFYPYQIKKLLSDAMKNSFFFLRLNLYLKIKKKREIPIKNEIFSFLFPSHSKSIDIFWISKYSYMISPIFYLKIFLLY